MAKCLLATQSSFPNTPALNREWVAWEDSKGYHAGGLNPLYGYRHLDGNVQPSCNSSDKTQTLAGWMSSLRDMANVRTRTLFLGEYYPRIFRPGANVYPITRTYSDIIETNAVSIDVLIDRMSHLFRVVEPAVANLDAFGHEIRNLLLLACMEVEAEWSAVLRANGYTTSSKTWKTTDYVKLLGPLHLAEYEVKLTSYPQLPPLMPFVGWNATAATQSLAWYHSYNQTKHDRERHFGCGTLRHAIDAVAASVILFFAQFGKADSEDDLLSEQLRFSQFEVTKWPQFPSEEWYVIQADSRAWTPVNYPL